MDGGTAPMRRQGGPRDTNLLATRQPTWASRSDSSGAPPQAVWGDNRRSRTGGGVQRGTSSGISYARNVGTDVAGVTNGNKGGPRAARRRSGDAAAATARSPNSGSRGRDGKRRGGHRSAGARRRGSVSGSDGSGAEDDDEDDVATLADLDAATKRIHALEKRLKRATHDLRAALSRLQTLEDDVVYMEARIRGAVEWRFALASIDVPLFGDPAGAKRACAQPPGEALGGALAVVQRSSWALVTDAIEVTTVEADGDAGEDRSGQGPEYEQIVCVNVVNPESGEVEHLYAPLFMSRGGAMCFSRYCASPEEVDTEVDEAARDYTSAKAVPGSSGATLVEDAEAYAGRTAFSAEAGQAGGTPPIIHVPGGFMFPSAPALSAGDTESTHAESESANGKERTSLPHQIPDASARGLQSGDQEAAPISRASELPFAS